MAKIKAISVRQPWAWLIVAGIKDIENRTRATSIRGQVAIHASKTVDQEGVAIVKRAFRSEGLGDIIPDEFPTGGIVGLVTIVDSVTESASEWFEGPHGWVLADPIEFEAAVPCKGQIGWFSVELDMI